MQTKLEVVVFVEAEPLFELGSIVTTTGAMRVLQDLDVSLIALVTRHISGDWSEMCEEDQETNKEAVKYGDRILSAYTLPDEQTKIWVITEWDRSVTTILLPEEY